MRYRILKIIIEYLSTIYKLKTTDVTQTLVKLTDDHSIDLIKLSNHIASKLNLDEYDTDCIQSALYQDVFDDSLIQIADHIARIIK